MGGFYSVRGYRENTLVRDNGVVLNDEYMKKLNIPSLSATVFVDTARGWDNDGITQNKQLTSVGGGIIWNNRKNLNVETFFGIPLMNKLNKTGDLQDLGLHFGAQYRL